MTEPVDVDRVIRDAKSDAIGLVRAAAAGDTRRVLTILSLPSDRQHNVVFQTYLADLVSEAFHVLPIQCSLDQWLDVKLDQIHDPGRSPGGSGA